MDNCEYWHLYYITLYSDSSRIAKLQSWVVVSVSTSLHFYGHFFRYLIQCHNSNITYNIIYRTKRCVGAANNTLIKRKKQNVFKEKQHRRDSVVKKKKKKLLDNTSVANLLILLFISSVRTYLDKFKVLS